MAKVTVSSKYQITIPMDMVRALHIQAGDKLLAEAIDDHMVLLREPENWVEYFKGSLKGVYGATVEEIDRYIAEERRSPERDEWREQFYDILATDASAQIIVNWLRDASSHTITESEFRDKINKTIPVNMRIAVEGALKRLLKHGGIREIKVEDIPEQKAFGPRYRLVHEFAEDEALPRK